MSLTLDQAKRAAVDERSRVMALEEWKIAFTGAEPEPPLMVRAPSEGDYFIVEFRQTGRPTALMLVNAATGEVEAITGIQTPGETLRFLPPEAIPAALEAYKHEQLRSRASGQGSYGDFRDGLLADFHPRYVTVEPELVWESCDQSLTPFKPFYQVQHAPPSRTDKFLVRVDGTPYPTTLTNGGRGM